MRIGSKKLRLNEDAHFRKGQFFYKEGLPFSNFKFRGQSTTNHRPKKKTIKRTCDNPRGDK